MGQTPSSTLWVLWGAFAASQLVFGGIAAFLYLQGPVGSPENAMMGAVIPAIGLVQAVLSLFVHRFLPGDFQTVSLIRWSLCESLTIMGFATFFLTGSIGILGACIGVTLAFLALHAPTDGARAKLGATR